MERVIFINHSYYKQVPLTVFVSFLVLSAYTAMHYATSCIFVQ